MHAERKRLEEASARTTHWRRWGPYLSERSWGNPREDYSAGGNSWDYFPHDHARSRAYRWTEDGLGGICDNHQRLCFSLALWNGHDPILKERLFGLGGNEGNHGEDVKEYYYYLDSTPTHSYMKFLYKYPQREFPYGDLVRVNRERSRREFEYELLDTGAFAEERYFDVFIEYAKHDVDDMLIRVNVINRGPERAELHLLPTLWFRNTWSWKPGASKPDISRVDAHTLTARERSIGTYFLWMDEGARMLFTENETNTERLWGHSSGNRFYKDAFHRFLIDGDQSAVNSSGAGTKACGWYQFDLDPGECRQFHLRLFSAQMSPAWPNFDQVFMDRIEEADEFYSFAPPRLSDDAKMVQRQAFAGLLWSKQFYHYVVEEWLRGDPGMPPPAPERLHGRNSSWNHLFTDDVLSMPDKWEYPWFAAWDLAFHMIPFAMVDPDFAKHQLKLLLREWYMSPSGQIPAYEWQFGDVNPPVHAWACLRVYKVEQRMLQRREIEEARQRGEHLAEPVYKGDRHFLEGCFHKLLMNFTWWVNRKDSQGKNIFEGGFLGLDNIGMFDRSSLPGGLSIEQSDATAWMAMYCLNMLRIASELTRFDTTYEDIASKFFEHFLYIAHSMNMMGDGGLWDEEDGFFYDRIQTPGGPKAPVRIRSMVGLIPLFAVATLDPSDIERLPHFTKRMLWFRRNRPDLCGNIAEMSQEGQKDRLLLALVQQDRLVRILERMLDENEFLSPYGIRAVSRYHKDHPCVMRLDSHEYRLDYEPAESAQGIFGGNSNWRGPVWFPVNYLIIESLQRFHHYFGDDLKVDFPTGSGNKMHLGEVAAEISRRLSRLFLRGDDGRRPAFGGAEKFQTDPYFRDHILFYEYFHADNGAGLGASHQTGWTALVAKLLQQSGER
jgi:hypothetical protein